MQSSTATSVALLLLMYCPSNLASWSLLSLPGLSPLGSCPIEPYGTDDGDSGTAGSYMGPCYRVSVDKEYCAFSSIDGDNEVAAVTTRQQAARIFELSADYHNGVPVQHSPATDSAIQNEIPGHSDRIVGTKYRLSQIPGKGFGVVATHPYVAGDLIMIDAPSLYVDACMVNEVPGEILYELQARALDHLSSSHRSALLNLSMDVTFGKDSLVGDARVGSVVLANAALAQIDNGQCDFQALMLHCRFSPSGRKRGELSHPWTDK